MKNAIKYELVGYSAFPDTPNIINRLIVKDLETQGEFAASLIEVQKLISDGELGLPELEEVQ